MYLFVKVGHELLRDSATSIGGQHRERRHVARGRGGGYPWISNACRMPRVFHSSQNVTDHFRVVTALLLACSTGQNKTILVNSGQVLHPQLHFFVAIY